MRVAFRVPDRPGSWHRPLPGVSFGGRRTMRTARRDRAWREHVALLARAAMAGRQPIDGPVRLEIDARWPSPRRTPPAWPWRPSVPDADNVTKAIADALNGVAYRDDAQVVDLRVTKQYAVGGDAGTSVTVTSIAGGREPE